MKPLIAVVNAHTRAMYQQCVRDTWLPLVSGADVRFFLGKPECYPRKDDEVLLDCDDSYQGLPSKVKAIVHWAFEQGYTHVCKLDDDVILRPTQFLNTGFEHYDFTGHQNDKRQYPVPFGFAYWMSRRSMQLVADATLPPVSDNNDERWVADVLSKVGIVLHNEPRYVMYTGKRGDFVMKGPRPLRAPKRPAPMFDPQDPAQVVAWCMYFNWAGWHTVSDEHIVLEMRKVFKEYVLNR